MNPTGFNTEIARQLGWCLLTLAGLSIVFQIILIVINSETGVPFISAGIWGGFFFALAGIWALAAASRPSRCFIVTLMVFSICSAIISIFGLFICSAFDLHVTRRNCDNFDYYSEVYYDDAAASTPRAAIALEDGAIWALAGNRRVFNWAGETEISSKEKKWYGCTRLGYLTSILLDSSLLLLAVLSTAASIWCSTLCCRAVCHPEPHPRFLYISPPPGASADVEATPLPVAAVVCVPVANGAVTSSQYLIDHANTRSVYTSTDGPKDDICHSVIRVAPSPILRGDGLPPYDPADLPPYQPAEISHPPYNPNYVDSSSSSSVTFTGSASPARNHGSSGSPI